MFKIKKQRADTGVCPYGLFDHHAKRYFLSGRMFTLKDKVN